MRAPAGPATAPPKIALARPTPTPPAMARTPRSSLSSSSSSSGACEASLPSKSGALGQGSMGVSGAAQLRCATKPQLTHRTAV
eukprot:scaffold71_cov247-Pinguiococcus_pyrenoidosus.AAC.25